jgi:hypothetical protein
MKRIISICFFLFFALSLNAQTKSPAIFGAASVKNKRMEISGTVLTAVGGITLFAGNIMFWKLYNNDSNGPPSQDKVDTSVRVMLGGLGLMAVGIPLLVIGKTKERNIRIEANLVNYKGSSLIKGIGVKIRF